MTNKIAIALGLLIIGILCLDWFVFGWDLHVFVGRKLGDLIEYLAFWR